MGYIAKELQEIIRSIKAYIEMEREAGCEDIISKMPRNGFEKRLDKVSSWKDLKNEVMGCKKCDLYKTRTNVVFGHGDINARLMFIGEAPGRDEDLKGAPFVGRAGQLLTKIIEAMGLRRKNVYITNVLMCRPPNNRSPLPTEILSCDENVRRQIELVKPKVICALGKFAAQTLLKTQTPISQLRGKFQDYHGVKLMPTFHPAYLLRNPQDKRLVWQDMKKIKKEIGDVSP